VLCSTWEESNNREVQSRLIERADRTKERGEGCVVYPLSMSLSVSYGKEYQTSTRHTHTYTYNSHSERERERDSNHLRETD